MGRYLFQRGIVPAAPLDAAIAARTRETARAQPRFAVRQKQRSSNPSTTAPDTHPSPGALCRPAQTITCRRRAAPLLTVAAAAFLPAGGVSQGASWVESYL